MDELNIHELAAILKRRRLTFAATAFGLFVLAFIFALTFSQYRSTAVVQIAPSDIAANMTNPLGMTQTEMMQALADQKVQQIQQKVTATASLIEIITKYDIYANARLTKPITDVVEGMRKKIKLELVSTTLSNPMATSSLRPDQLSAIAFTLSFTYSEPLKAQQVANELLSHFLDEDLKQRRTKADETSSFMDSQLKTLEESMKEQESKIADFRNQHPDSRPEALALNQQLMATTYQNLLQVEAQIATVSKTRGDIRTQLASTDPYSRVVADGQLMTTPAIQLKALQAKYASSSSLYSPDHPDMIKLRHQIEALQKEVGQAPDTAEIQSQLNDARANLAAAQQTYGPEHPDVSALRRRVTTLEDALAQQAHDPTSHTAIKKDADNPAYLMLSAQLQAAEQEYKSLENQRDGLRREYERYQTNVAQTPGIEQEFASLSRDYENAQLRYRELKEKKLTADMEKQIEVGRMAERLLVIDPPELPTDTHPKRLYLILGGFVVSIMGGLGGVMLHEIGSRSVHGTRHLTTLTGMPPLVAVPHIFTREERRKITRRRLRLGAAAVVVLLVASIVIDQFVIPIDVVASIVARRLGIS